MSNTLNPAVDAGGSSVLRGGAATGAIKFASEVSVSLPLTNLAIEYRSKAASFVRSELFPRLSQPRSRGSVYAVDPLGEHHRLVNTKRAPGSPANMVDSLFTSPVNYIVENHALAMKIPDEVRYGADSAIARFIGSMDPLMHMLNLDAEKDAFDTFTAAIDTADALDAGSHKATPGTKWLNSGGNPVTDILGYVDILEARMYRRPTKMILGSAQVMRQLAHHDDVVSKYAAYTQGPSSTVAGQGAMLTLLSQVFDMRVVLANVFYNAGAKGVTPTTGTSLWGDSVILTYDDAPSATYGGVGLTVTNDNVLSDVSAINGYAVFTGRAPSLEHSDIMAAYDFRDTVVTNIGAAYYAYDVLA